MQNSRKYTVLGCLLFILLPAIVCGDNNGEEPIAIYLDVGNEIQNVISLVKKHETKLNDFDDKLLRIQNMLENFEKEFSKLEQNCMAALEKNYRFSKQSLNRDSRQLTLTWRLPWVHKKARYKEDLVTIIIDTNFNVDNEKGLALHCIL